MYIFKLYNSKKYVSKFIIHQKILLIYQIFIEVIQIIAQISIWKKSLIFGLTCTLSSKKLNPVIKNQKTQMSHNLKLYSKKPTCTEKNDSKKNQIKITTHIP